MKTTKKTFPRHEAGFDAVKFMRQQRNKLSGKLTNMSKEEILEYFRKRKSQTTTKPCAYGTFALYII
jgi:hypothetical protein